MSKLLRLRDYVLIAAGIAGEVFEEIRLVHGVFPAALEAQYGFVPACYKRRSYLATVSQLLSTGDITRSVNKKGRVYLELTSVGKHQLVRRFPLLFKENKWDGFFMVVVFDILEQQRSTRKVLRSKLTELGFGMLQESVWISPYHFEDDMREFLYTRGLGDNVFVLKAEKLWAGNIKQLARKIWNLDSINKCYLRVIRKIKKSKDASTIVAIKKQLIKDAYSLYLETLSLDPLLPKELLPRDWPRSRAIEILNRESKVFRYSI